jgi:hypothetical protein
MGSRAQQMRSTTGRSCGGGMLRQIPSTVAFGQPSLACALLTPWSDGLPANAARGILRWLTKGCCAAFADVRTMTSITFWLFPA